MSEDTTTSQPPAGGRHGTAKSGAAAHGRLVVLAGDQLGRRFLVQGKETIGRSDDATIAFDDAELSRNHARIRREAQGRYVLEDLGSSNGTLLNGVPVTRAALAYGDKIQLGSNIVLMFSRYDLVEEQLVQRRRVEMLGRLAAGVAHDLNNMLTVIASSLHGIRSCSEAGAPELAEWLEDLETATGRATALAPRLLRCAQTTCTTMRGDVDLSSLCDDVCQLIRHGLDYSINIELDIQPGLVVAGRVEELHQGLMNLCLNARDAMPEGGTLAVTASLASRESLRQQPLPSKGTYVLVSVSDTGAGMNAETEARVFEPFFTTKTPGGGIGLGLANVKETVTNHGGCIAVRSLPGKGSTFDVFLPAARTPGQSVATSATIDREHARRAVPSGATVLVADAEAIVRRSWCRLLSGRGYVAVAAATAEAALALCESGTAAPALAIVDTDLPVIADVALHRQLRELHPLVPVLLTAPHADPLRCAAALAEGARGLLAKPVAPPMLLAEVERILSEAEVPGDGKR
ncbi:MAG: FHA domain-containing protein [Deltaproteobacteria bacterium]|nr:FHA domain-containing protein [Deltaproteobacteria bacterium]